MSKHFKTEGIVIKRINFNEADQIVTVLTRDYGKINCIAKNSRRFKNRLSGRLELAYQVDITGFQGRSLDHLNEVEIMDARQLFDLELKTTSIIFYITEITNKLLQDGQQIDGVYSLLLYAIDHLNHDQYKNEVILYAYLIKLLTLLGFMAPWDRCARSNVKLNLGEPLYLNIRDGSVIRSGYNSSADVRLTPPLIKWVNFMQKQSFAALIKVAPSKGEKVQVWYMIKTMLENILNYPVKAEEFLNMVC
jgi:DNA repair protein RecO (recombination protein O)